MTKLSHLDEQGRAAMVDVTGKAGTERAASAEAIVVLSEEAFNLIVAGDAPKGDVLGTARIAGIMAAKKTSELIPLCHPLALSHVGVEFAPLPERHAFRIVASAKTAGQTGVEMEAMTAAGVAALTLYDMVKGVDRSARIESIRLLTKSGGKSGTYRAEAEKESSPVSAPSGGRRARPSPKVLVHETSAPRAAGGPPDERKTLRAFMLERRLRATEWAKSADVPVGELYAYLNGRSRVLAPATAERLARAARARIDDMFGRKAR